MISSSSMTRIEPGRTALFATSDDAVRGIRSGLPVHRLRHRARAEGERQRQRKAGSLAERAVARNRPAVFLDDAVGDRQPKTRAFADRLGGEERIVNARELIRRDSGTGVGDLDSHSSLMIPGDD